MTTLRYTPGAWRAVVTPRGVAVLPSGVDAAMLESIWGSLDAGNGLGAVLESLTGAFGTSLRSIPPFAVATVAGAEVRLAVRGELAIEVDEGDDSPLLVSGADVTTWSERVVASARSLTVRTPTAPGPGADWFPIASGVVLAAAVTLALAETPVPAAKSAATAPVVSLEKIPAPEPQGIQEETILPEEAVEEVEAAEGVEAADGPVEPATAETETPVEAGGTEDGGTEDGETDAELEFTRDELPDDAYDHLWGATVVKSVEEAAVRDVDEDDEIEAAPARAVVAETAPADVPAASVPAAAPTTPVSAGFAPPAAPAAPASGPIVPPPPSTGLIDSVPNFGGVGASSGSDSLVGRTVPPTPPAAPPTTPLTPGLAPATGGTPAVAAIGDDHDGLTVTVSELEAMRRLGAAQAAAPALPASALGRIVLSTGETHPLDRPVIIGRRPRANRVQADQVPVLITVASPEQDISRNHLEVRLEGRHVLVVDLATTNGSVLHREGTPPLRLGPNEPVLVLSGDIVDIGDGVTVAFEEIV
jgi:hypothetical protein